MADQTTEGNQDNAVSGNWYDSFAGDDQTRAEALSKFDSFDSFFEDYNGAKNRDWRADIAGDDEKFLSKLQRFDSPAAFGSTYREAEQRIRSGDIGPKPPGEGATDEEIKEYRRAVGVPLTPDEYLKELPDGLVFGDVDKPFVEGFAKFMHEANMPPATVHKVLEFYNGIEEQAQDVMLEADLKHKQEAEDTLRETWGADFRANMNVVNAFLDSTFGKDGKEALMNGRYADGRGFFNNPDVLRALAEIGRKVNPLSTILPRGEDDVKGLEAEISELEKFMRTNRSEYNKDEKKQARLRDLYEMRLKFNKGQSAA